MSVRQTLSGKPEPGRAQHGQRQPEQRRELLDASPELQDLLLEFRLREVHTLQTDHDQGRRAEPAARRRPRDVVSRGDREVPGALDESPEAMVITLLWAECRHAEIIGRSPTSLNDESSRTCRSAGVRSGGLPPATTTRAKTCRMSLRTAGVWRRMVPKIRAVYRETALAVAGSWEERAGNITATA
jgi:hypothetical protein